MDVIIAIPLLGREKPASYEDSIMASIAAIVSI